MVHSGLTALTVPGYDEGWRDLLGRLASVSEGTPVEPLEPPLSTGAEYASRLNTILTNAVQTLEALPESAWQLPVPNDGRSVGVVAGHMADHIGLVEVAVAVRTDQPRSISSKRGGPDVDSRTALGAGLAVIPYGLAQPMFAPLLPLFRSVRLTPWQTRTS